MSDRLLFAFIIDDGIASGLRAGYGCGGDGDKLDTSIFVFLIQIDIIFRHLAVELDTFSHIKRTASAYCKNSVALGNLEEVNPFTDILIKGIGCKVIENDIWSAHIFYVILYAEERETSVTNQKDFG